MQKMYTYNVFLNVEAYLDWPLTYEKLTVTTYRLEQFIHRSVSLLTTDQGLEMLQSIYARLSV